MTKDEALDLALEALEAATTAQNKIAASKHAEWLWLKTEGLSHKEEEELKDAYYAAEKEAAAVARRRDSLSVEAMSVIKQALAQPAPVQEPVAWIEHHKGGDNLEWDNPGGKCTPLYTTPPAQPAPDNQRAHEMALRQWESWKQYALELQEKLVKYEGGAPMVLNTTPPAQPAPVQEPVAYRSLLASGSYTYCNTPQFFDNAQALYTTPPEAQPAVQEPVAWMHTGGHIQGRNPNWEQGIADGYTRERGWTPLYTTPPEAQPAVQEPVAWVDLLKKAEEVVRSKPLWKKYIDGTPLANDIAVWMASFAQEHITPPAAQRQWVGLTDEAIWSEYQTLWSFHPAEEPRMAKDIAKFARAIEAKLKEKNNG